MIIGVIIGACVLGTYIHWGMVRQTAKADEMLRKLTKERFG